MSVPANDRWHLEESYAAMLKFVEEACGDSLGGSTAVPPRESGVASSNGAPAASEANGDGGGGEKMSKNQLKRAAKGKDKPKVKDANWSKPKEGVPKAAKAAAKPKKEEIVWEYQGPADGAKKDCSGAMPDKYQPQYVEAAWQDYWEKSGFYGCSAERAKAAPEGAKFVMVIPPPNVTGSLHLGHALTGAIEDTLTRWHRMRGDAALWVPGIDHAGIATQTVVEKKLQKDEGVSRHDLGREAFIKRVWEWKETYGGKIQNQIRRLGSSVDWNREVFTMDAKLSRAVTEAFCRFYEAGLIYRDTRLVNWSCALKSAISDIEVDYVELEGRTMMPAVGHSKQKTYEFGTLTHFAYKVEEPVGSGKAGAEELVVATTRLETMLGDTAVAVHPDDKRYTHLHGKFLIHPFNGRKIPIVLDGVLVDMEFGTGAVKVTPAHDPNDYECGKRNNLPMINILSADGSMNADAAPFTGQMRYDARVAVEKALDDMGLLRGKEPNKMRLGVCSRSGDVIEPYLAPQWYVRCEGMAKRATDSVRSGELTIKPSFHEKTWFQWLDYARDWCVSRQLWWGHRIPAYYVTRKSGGANGTDASEAATGEELDRWVVARSSEEAAEIAAKRLNCAATDVTVEQDPDVLDTWFSSGLFPFSVFGWPDNTDDLAAFYPTTLLETGMDILFFWVARMVMMAQQLTDKLPFTTVYLHAMVRDKYGRKMSKSLGNVIDPLEVIDGCTLEALHAKLDSGNLPKAEVAKAKQAQTNDFPNGIPRCGADALRFGLLSYTVQGRDVNLDTQRLVGYSHFCNKLWNAARFALGCLGVDLSDGASAADASAKGATTICVQVPTLSLADLMADQGKAPRDKWILSRLRAAAAECNKCLLNYEFAGLTTAAYNFWLYELCDVYLELVKPVVNSVANSSTAPEEALKDLARSRACLRLCVDWGLRLLHPVMPFVTEELWQRLPAATTCAAEHKEEGAHSADSIMVARYPDPEGTSVSPGNLGSELQADAEAESRMAATMAVVKAARSLRADYNLAPRETIEVFVVSESRDALAMLEAQADDIATLTKASAVRFLPTAELARTEGVELVAPPPGCSVKVVDMQTSLHVPLQALVDFEAEAAKMERDAAKLAPSIDSLEKQMSLDGYTTKVPESVREANVAKLEELKTKRENMLDAATRFKALCKK